ncbi:hypothetical protein AVEN_87378-1 [Araneus ventricosus]|uniref:Uncharacterized protein n=1 Tax=Araneus ventricosus TaxID=182803 RepID=A0A4Y2IF96_ARAVE|nr:hypothetical protein AVEN_87378-1 [Araneus ventricosus]
MAQLRIFVNVVGGHACPQVSAFTLFGFQGWQHRRRVKRDEIYSMDLQTENDVMRQSFDEGSLGYYP